MTTVEASGSPLDLESLTVKLIRAYVSNNSLPRSELGSLIRNTHAVLAELVGHHSAAMTDEIKKPTKAEIRKSITSDGLISFVDGKNYKVLTWNLKRHNLNPASYRARFSLPEDYPVVAPGYRKSGRKSAKVLA